MPNASRISSTRARGLPRRVGVVVVVFALAAVSLLGSGSASADQISDKRAEAARVTDQLEDLQERAEMLAEQYNDARLALEALDRKAEAARSQSVRTQASLASRRAEVAGYAVNAYVRGGTGTTASVLLNSADGNEIGRRTGYASAAAASGADLIDGLRATKAKAEADATSLKAAQAEATKAKAAVDAKREATDAAVNAQQAVVDKVQGELASLVRAEQARRAAAAAAKARELAARLAAQQASQAASRPTVSRGDAESSGAADVTSDDSGSDAGATAEIAPPVGVGADAAIAAARSVLGVRYTWAGASPSSGFDCSGLVMWAWQHGGKSLPHSSRAMYGSSRRIPMSAIQPGDLIFYGSPIHHVALYIGGGQIIHAPHSGSYVQVASVYYWSDVVGAGRV